MTEGVEVSVWRLDGPVFTASYRLIGAVTYTRLEFTVQHRDLGAWSMTLPKGTQSEKIKPGCFVTTRFRGDERTWTIEQIVTTQNEDGDLEVTVSGFNAVSVLGWTVAWPDPLSALDNQPAEGNFDNIASRAVGRLVGDNVENRRGIATWVIGNDDGATFGSSVISRPRFINLFEEAQRIAKRGNFGFRLELESRGSNPDTLRVFRLSYYAPRTLTTRVHFSAADGSIGSWELTETAPTATRAVVGGAGEGAGQFFYLADTTEGTADAAKWGNLHREIYVDGTDTFDIPPLQAAGADAIAEGAATTTLTMEAQEPVGAKAFVTYRPGDICTWIPYGDVKIAAEVTAIRVTHEGAGEPVVASITGDPDEEDPQAKTAALIRALRRRFDKFQTIRKRGAV